ncbi:TonB-dependent receptor [Agriterribacter sp.]|uniref:TonB-dependent receptor n=1 Tax=Agriterribacter sp. TaxID=2821509 RepID=UPI002C8E766A|nr:TonB-dependent receptor [Agriterribacter sp.]HRP55521.1 TonB-dependent receptor [Agriterribacter sp.]
MKVPAFSIWLLLCLSSASFGQSVISGKIKDNKDRPIAGASITLKDTYDGATSDSSGNFSFTTTEKGKLLLTISAVGYRSAEQSIDISAPAVTANAELREEVSELKAVVITAGSFEAGDKKRVTVLNSIDVATTAGANADVTAALKTLPGAQQVGESEGLFVRGGTATETKIFIDGTLVNNFFYSSVPGISQRGRFSPFLFKGTVFSTGGYSALYGQALSSALILESIDLPEQSSGDFGISPLSINGGYQHLAKNKKSSWGASYSYANLWLAFKSIKQRPDYFKVPDAHTADVNFRIKTSETGMLKYYGYFSANQVGIRNPSLDTMGYKDVFSIRNFNMYHNMAYRENLGSGWKLNGGISYSNNKDDITGKLQDAYNKDVVVDRLEFKNFDVSARGNYFNAKLVFDKRLRGISVFRFGTEYNYNNDKTDYTLYSGSIFSNSIVDHTTALFAETDIYLTNDLAAKLGTRFEHASLINKNNIAPRVSLAYKTGRHSQASMAYGIFYQNPERKYIPSPAILTFSKATHYIAQYQSVTDKITFRTEIFYKKYNDLIKTDMINPNQQVAINNNGFGDAKGIEFFWRDKKTFKDFDYWISYSYLDTKRDFVNFPYAIQPNFAAKHTASLVMKKFVTSWKTGFNMSYTYASGRPYYNIIYDGSKYTFSDLGKTKDYHNISFSANYLPNLFNKESRRFTVLVLSVNNIFGIDQVYGYNYSYNGYRKSAILPPSRTFVFIGAFISLGVDRTEDAINSNL